MKRTTKTIAFRLPAEYVKQLAAESLKHGMSPGGLARHFVIESLEDEGEKDFTEDLGKLEQRLTALNLNLARATVALLADAGKAERSEALDWVRKNMTTV